LAQSPQSDISAIRPACPSTCIRWKYLRASGSLLKHSCSPTGRSRRNSEGHEKDFPFLRLATVPGCSRDRLARARYQALFGSGGARDRAQAEDSAAYYQDVVHAVCRPTPDLDYKQAIAVEADGEVLGASCAEIEMAGLDVLLLSSCPSPTNALCPTPRIPGDVGTRQLREARLDITVHKRYFSSAIRTA